MTTEVTLSHSDLNPIKKVKITLKDELNCSLSYENESNLLLKALKEANRLLCNVTWDGVTCWPPTPADETVHVSCFSELNGINYASNQNASRHCHINGSWAEKSDYSRCGHYPIIDKKGFQTLWDVREAKTVYYCGYTLSLVALVIALFIFFYFKDLRCLRNTIHINLMVTYVLFELTWISISALMPDDEIYSDIKNSTTHNYKDTSTQPWCLLFVLLTYFIGTNFFWMFVEGLYLYILVVKTFSSTYMIKIPIFALIGWGLPAINVFLWASLQWFLSPDNNATCVWQNQSKLDYIFVVPFVSVILVNTFFLQNVMWVLITKLRAATSIESKQYRKAAKALLVLIPLLGVTYILVLVTPTSPIAKIIVTYLQAFLLSTQGFTVAVSYCFLNGEVRNAVRHHWNRWRTTRTLGGNDYYSASRYRSSHYSEGMKLPRNDSERHQSSCASYLNDVNSSYTGNKNSNAL